MLWHGNVAWPTDDNVVAACHDYESDDRNPDAQLNTYRYADLRTTGPGITAHMALPTPSVAVLPLYKRDPRTTS